MALLMIFFSIFIHYLDLLNANRQYPTHCKLQFDQFFVNSLINESFYKSFYKT